MFLWLYSSFRFFFYTSLNIIWWEIHYVEETLGVTGPPEVWEVRLIVDKDTGRHNCLINVTTRKLMAKKYSKTAVFFKITVKLHIYFFFCPRSRISLPYFLNWGSDRNSLSLDPFEFQTWMIVGGRRGFGKHLHRNMSSHRTGHFLCNILFRWSFHFSGKLSSVQTIRTVINVCTKVLCIWCPC